MRLSERANERLWDSFLCEVLIEDCKKELEELEGGEEHLFSDEFEHKLRGIKRTVGRKETALNILKAARIITVTAASVLGICFVMLLTQPKIYAAVGSVIKEVFSDYDRYSYQGVFDGEFDDQKRLGYLPKGYKLRRIDYYDDKVICLSYKNDGNDLIEFQYGIAAECELSVYPNDREYIEKTVGGRTYYLYISNDKYDRWSYAVWYDGDYIFSISGQLGEDEIVKIAENVIE